MLMAFSGRGFYGNTYFWMLSVETGSVLQFG